jgi:hypothetical protein
MVHQDVALVDQTRPKKGLTNQIHLVVKLTEEDIFMKGDASLPLTPCLMKGSIVPLDDVMNGIQLGRGTDPIRTVIRRARSLSIAINVNLRMNGNLTKTKEHLEHLSTTEMVPAILDSSGLMSTLNTMIELLLFLTRERQDHLMYDGNGRSPSNDRAKGIEGAMKEEGR